MPPVSLTPVANLPPVVHLDLRISPRIFEKIRNYPNVTFRGSGEDDDLNHALCQRYHICLTCLQCVAKKSFYCGGGGRRGWGLTFVTILSLMEQRSPIANCLEPLMIPLRLQGHQSHAMSGGGEGRNGLKLDYSIFLSISISNTMYL